jgi:hypothetical protein
MGLEVNSTLSLHRQYRDEWSACSGRQLAVPIAGDVGPVAKIHRLPQKSAVKPTTIKRGGRYYSDNIHECWLKLEVSRSAHAAFK